MKYKIFLHNNPFNDPYSPDFHWIVKVLASHLGYKKSEYLYCVYLFSILQYLISNSKKTGSDKSLDFLQQRLFQPKSAAKSEQRTPVYEILCSC